MFEYLERIRQKPREERMRITLLSAGVITAVIFLVWLTVVAFGGGEAPAPAPSERRSFAEERQKFSEFWKGAGERFRGIQEGFNELKN